MARFGEKQLSRDVCKSVGARSQPVGGSFWRDGNYRETCVGGSKASSALLLCVSFSEISSFVSVVCTWAMMMVCMGTTPTALLSWETARACKLIFRPCTFSSTGVQSADDSTMRSMLLLYSCSIGSFKTQRGCYLRRSLDGFIRFVASHWLARAAGCRALSFSIWTSCFPLCFHLFFASYRLSYFSYFPFFLRIVWCAGLHPFLSFVFNAVHLWSFHASHLLSWHFSFSFSLPIIDVTQIQGH